MSDANWSSPSSSRSAFSGLRQLLSLFEQSSDLSHLRPNADVDELPPIEINDKKYIKEEWTQRKRKRSARVTHHGTYLILLPEKKTFWLCGLCDKKHETTLFNAQSTDFEPELN
jgi:CRISPR/Cas system-associated protein Cas10 (large subunit of type III CRISPR-Cas system)